MQFNEVKIALAVSAALASIGAQAQESVRTEEVRVTASRVEQELMDVPMSVSVVTAQEIIPAAMPCTKRMGMTALFLWMSRQVPCERGRLYIACF